MIRKLFLYTFALVCFLTAAYPDTPSDGLIKFGEEFLLPDNSGKGQQDTPAISFGKTVYLVVWTEGVAVEGARARIKAVRISMDGKVLDTTAIDVAPNKNTDGHQVYPRVTFCGDVF